MRGNLMRELFAFEATETRGELLHFKLYEAFLTAYTVLWCWEWSASIRTTPGVAHPLGIATYVDISPIFTGEVARVNAALVTLGVLLGLARIAPRLGYTVAFAGFHLQYIARFSLGEICHASNFVGMGMLGLAAAMWLFRDAAERRKFTLGASYFFVGLAYVSAAVSKVVASGPGWVDGRNLWMWIGEKSVDAYSKFGTLDYTFVQEWALASRPFATLLLTTGLLIEAGGVLLWYRKPRPYVALLCISLHLNIYFTMNIMFDMSIYHLFVLCLPWAQLFDRGLQRAEATSLARFDALATRFA